MIDNWKPAGSEKVAALECALSGDPGETKSRQEAAGSSPVRAIWPVWPLVFAEPRSGFTGIEWVHENSDQVVQRGAYRWMAAVL